MLFGINHQKHPEGLILPGVFQTAQESNNYIIRSIIYTTQKLAPPLTFSSDNDIGLYIDCIVG
jgi:hypothetical protein